MVLEVAQVTRADLLGGRFNGFSIRHRLEQRGVHSSLISCSIQSRMIRRRIAYSTIREVSTFVATMSRWDYRWGLHAMFQVHSFGLPANRLFRRADVVHYHVVHDGFFSIAALPVLARLKPSIWTWHDPWIMTGHCMHPMECDRWRIGCGECPDLTRTFEMKFDNTRRAFALKRAIVRHSPIDIIVASRWMLDMARASPMAVGARLHYIPFGVDLSRFKPRDQAAAKARFGVLPDRVVVAARGFISPYKGVTELAAALERIETPLCVLSLHDLGGFDRLIGRHQVIGLDWTDDEDALIDAYTATDFFVMPSMGEAFGMMAVEAMACGKPVVVFEGDGVAGRHICARGRNCRAYARRAGVGRCGAAPGGRCA